MTEKPKTEPLVGFHITDYDEASETLTISVDPRLFTNNPSAKAIAEKAIEITISGPGVSKVVFVPR